MFSNVPCFAVKIFSNGWLLMNEQKNVNQIGVKSRVFNGLARQKTRLKCFSVYTLRNKWQILQFYDCQMKINDASQNGLQNCPRDCPQNCPENYPHSFHKLSTKLSQSLSTKLSQNLSTKLSQNLSTKLSLKLYSKLSTWFLKIVLNCPQSFQVLGIYETKVNKIYSGT